MAVDPDVQTLIDGLDARLIELESPLDNGIRYLSLQGDDNNNGLTLASAHATLNRALSDRSKVIVVAPGGHRLSGPTAFESKTNIIGYGPYVSRFYWDADGGICFDIAGGGRKYVKGIGFHEGLGKPDCWIDNSDDLHHDWSESYDDCFFGAWNTETGQAAIKTGNITNLQLHRVRFGAGGSGGGRGPAIWAKGDLGAVDITQFTVDSQNAGPDIFGGLLRVDRLTTGGQQMTIRIAGGRIEASGADYASPRGIIHLNGAGKAIPAHVLMENIQINLGMISNPHYVLWNDENNAPLLTTIAVSRTGNMTEWIGGGTSPPSTTPAIWTNGIIEAS